MMQAAYAIVAFPISTCLSIAPMFLHFQQGVPIHTIGLFMACGELLGIFAMKAVESSHRGFLVNRPHDLHLITFILATSLILIPASPASMWYLSAIALISVQTFNSASKPIVAESLYRLSTIKEKDPNKGFAVANMWRRIVFSTLGASTKLVYEISPGLSFYVVAAIVIIFLAILAGTACMIEATIVDVAEVGNTYHSENCEQSLSDKSKDSVISNLKNLQNMKTPKRESFEHRRSLPNFLILQLLSKMSEEEDDDDDDDKNYLRASDTVDDISSPKIKDKANSEHEKKNEEEIADEANKYYDVKAITEEEAGSKYETNSSVQEMIAMEDGKGRGQVDKEKVYKNVSSTDYILIVNALAFWDAAVTRLPFAFLTIAISLNNKMWVATVILFSNQASRAVAQSIQVWHCKPVVGYILNSLALITYIFLVAYLYLNPEGSLWYIPFAFAGLAETLPIQQFYVMRLYNSLRDDDIIVRQALKASHTSTGIGSIATFIATSQVYSRLGLKAVSILALLFQSAKMLTNIIIDVRHNRIVSNDDAQKCP